MITRIMVMVVAKDDDTEVDSAVGETPSWMVTTIDPLFEEKYPQVSASC